MFESVKITADKLEYGDKFVFQEFFGIRTRLHEEIHEGPANPLWYTDLVTGELHTLFPSEEVEKFENMIELVTRFYETGAEPIQVQHVESLEELADFLGFEIPTWGQGEKS